MIVRGPGNRSESLYLISSYVGVGQEIALNEISATSSSTWPVANLALFFPIRVTDRCLVTGFATVNTVSSGNIDVGLYTYDGSLVVSIGSTAMAGTNAWQAYDTTDTLIPAGFYYLAMAVSNTTASFSRMAPTAGLVAAWGVREQSTAFPLPSSMAASATTRAYVPVFVLMKTSKTKITT